MNITLFGGSFNPPHLGHIIVIEQSFKLIPGINDLWVLPAYNHTFQKNLAPSGHRKKMTEITLNTLSPNIKPHIKLETIEIDQKLSGETYETLKLLKTKHPNHNFSFLMGTDQLESFKKWGNWKKLLEKMHFYIYPRSGYQNNIKFPNMTLLKSSTQVVTNISSTLIRKRVSQKLPLAHLVPLKVLKFINTNNLFKK